MLNHENVAEAIETEKFCRLLLQSRKKDPTEVLNRIDKPATENSKPH